MRALIRSLGMAWRGLTVVARLGVMAMLLLVWLASSVLTAALPGAFLFASSLAGLVVDTAQTVKGRQAAKVKDLDDKLAHKSTEADGLAKENKRLKAELEVDIRGKRVPVRQAVKETTEKAAKRIATATARNVLTMPGEALPFVGIAVVVGATAWEVSDACAIWIWRSTPMP